MDIPLGTPPEFVIKVRREIAIADIGARECLNGDLPAPVPRPPLPEPEFDVEKHDKPIPPRISSGPSKSGKVQMPTFAEDRRYPDSRLRDSPLTKEIVLALYEEYQTGLSLRDCIKDRWEAWGYKSQQSCAGALGIQFKAYGFVLRTRWGSNVTRTKRRRTWQRKIYESEYYGRPIPGRSPERQRLIRQAMLWLNLFGSHTLVCNKEGDKISDARAIMYEAGRKLGIKVSTRCVGNAVIGKIDKT